MSHHIPYLPFAISSDNFLSFYRLQAHIGKSRFKNAFHYSFVNFFSSSQLILLNVLSFIHSFFPSFFSFFLFLIHQIVNVALRCNYILMQKKLCKKTKKVRVKREGEIEKDSNDGIGVERTKLLVQQGRCCVHFEIHNGF